jgi:endonuclease-3
MSKITEILAALTALYPTAHAELNFTNPFETLIATILSAQCTDARVNKVTAKLFAKYPDAAAMVKLSQAELEDNIRECGLFHNKAKNILAACKALIDEYDGVVPSERGKLMALPGVGQKTAGVVLLAAFGADEIPVDTHVYRVSKRIGLANANTADKVEAQLRAVIPEGERARSHHLLIWHGRKICHAQRPKCESCPLVEGLCEYKLQTITQHNQQ